MLIYCTIIDEEPKKSDFEVMYYHYRKLLYQVADEILHDHFLSEEAVSQTFWKAAKNFSKIIEPICPKIKRFLVIVCERTAIDLYRARKRDNLERMDALEFTQWDWNVPVAPEEEGTLGAAIARLPKTYREVILLRYADGYTAEETHSCCR